MRANVLKSIAELRERREKIALADLQNRNRARDVAADAFSHLEQHIVNETDAAHRQERSLYTDVIGDPVSGTDVLEVVSAVNHARAQINVLVAQRKRLERVVNQTADAASVAKMKHAGLLFAERKWEKLVDETNEKEQREDNIAQELLTEELPLTKKFGQAGHAQ